MFRLPNRPEARVPTASWHGSLPETWRALPGRALFAEQKSVGHDSEPLLSVTISRGVVPQAEYLADGTKKDSSNLDRSKYKLVRPGEIAYNKMRAWQGAVGLSCHRGIVSPAYVVMQPRGQNARYMEQLMRTPAFAKEAERWSYGITSDMWSLRPEHFKMIYFPVPPADEQAAIVKYLAHAHARIDKAIAAKRKMIALLEEQKQAVVHQAVTRGLDPNVPLKDSSIPWLGEIPAHWRLARFKDVAWVDGALVDPRVDPFASLQLIAPNHVVRAVGVLKATSTAAAQGADSGKYEVRGGQIVYSKIRPYLRKAAIAPTHALCSADMYPISSRPTIATDFLLLVMLSAPFTDYVVDASLRASIPKVNREALSGAPMWLPPRDEQLEITRHVANASKTIDGTATRLVQEVGLLREFRTRLTSDVVTGQVDVRAMAANLPDLAEDTLAAISGVEGESVEDAAEEFLEGEPV